MRWICRAIHLLPLALAAGCGFHLRGEVPPPAVAARPYIETGDRYSPLYAALTSQLRAAGAILAPDAATASAVIRLHVDSTGRELLSIAANNKPGEYEVYYAAEYSVTAGGQELLARQQARLTRGYSYDEAGRRRARCLDRRLGAQPVRHAVNPDGVCVRPVRAVRVRRRVGPSADPGGHRRRAVLRPWQP